MVNFQTFGKSKKTTAIFRKIMVSFQEKMSLSFQPASWYAFDCPWKDEGLSESWSHGSKPGPLDL